MQPSIDQMTSAILHALPAHIAVVDSEGVILSVNKSWKRFAIANVFQRIDFVVGSNYLEVCEQTHGGCAEEAKILAEGLRAVLAGKQKTFTLEYPFHAPTLPHWFRVMITPVSETKNAAAVVMHLDMTERGQAQQTQKLSHQVFESSPDHISIVSCDYRYRQVNPAYQIGHGLLREKIVGMHVADLLGKDVFRQVVKPNFDRCLRGEVVDYESWFTFRDRGQRYMEVTYSPLRSVTGEVEAVVVVARDATDRKRSEEALTKSEAQRRLAMGAAKVGTWTWDVTTNEVFWSENVGKLFGLPQGTIAGTYQAYLDLIHPLDLPRVKEAIAQTVDHDAAYELEHRIIWPDQTIHWLACRGQVLRDANTKPLWMAGMVVDVTERKHAEGKKLESESRFRAILDNSPGLIFIKDLQGRYLEVNRQFEKVFHRTRDEIIGKTDNQIFPPKQAAEFRANDKLVIQSKIPREFEEVALHDDGSHTSIVFKFLLRDYQDEPYALCGITTDITKRKQVEETLQESRARFEGIIRTAIDAIISVDVNQRIVVFNPAAETMFGCAAEKAIGKSLDQFIPHRFLDAHRRYIREFGQTGTTPRAMGRLGMVYGLRADGKEFPIEASISKVGIGKSKLFTVILRDITARLQAEQSLQRSEERLELALKGANLGVWDWNMQTGEVHHDNQWLEMLGYTVDELEPTFESWEQRLHPQDKQSVLKTLQDHIDSVTPFYQTEYRLRTKIRKWKWILDIGKVVSRDPKGKPLRATGTHQDITNRKEAEQELSKEREFISAVLETAGALVVVLDRQGRVVRFNRACEELTGFSFEEVQGKLIWDLVLPSEEVPAVKRALRSLRHGQGPLQLENHWVTRDKQRRFIAWSNTTLANEKGRIEYVIGTGIDITERKMAEQTVDHLWRQNEMILHSAGEGIYGIDLNGKATFFNQAAQHLTGWEKDKIQGKALHPFLHHSKPDGTPYPPEECPIYSSLKDGTVHHIDAEVLWRKDGTSFPVEYTSTPIVGKGGNIEGAVVAFKDITERKKAEEKVRKLSKVFMNAADPIIIEDLEGRVIELNDEAVRAYGWSRTELLGKPIKMIVPPDRHAQADGLLRRCRNQEDVRNVEGLRRTKRGKIIPVLLTLSLLTDETGKSIGIATMAKDISKLKQAESKIRESEERFQAFMNHSPAVAFLKDEQGRYVYVDRSFEEKLNRSAAECLGKTDLQLFPPDIARVFKEHDREVLQKGGVLETEETTLDEKGNVHSWLVMKFPVHSMEGQLLLGGVALDITVRKKAEEALRERELELKRSQHELQALGGRLISAQEDERRRISRELHDDMNQRLAVLALDIQSTQREIAESDPMFQTFQKLYDEVAALSDDVRHLAYQLHPSILDDLGLEVAVQSFIEDFSKWEGIPVTFTAKGLPRSIPPEVASCLYRLGQESLRNVARHAQASNVHVTLTSSNGILRMCVEDKGKGFDLEAVRSGLGGLGLIGMQERIRLVQGELTIKSRPGEGTEIRASVPLTHAVT